MTPEQIGSVVRQAVEGAVAPIVADVNALKGAAVTRNTAGLNAGGSQAPAVHVGVRAITDRVKQHRSFLEETGGKRALLAIGIAEYLRTMAFARIHSVPMERAAQQLGYAAMAERLDSVRRDNMSAGAFADGGALIAEAYMPELIELLRATAVVRKAGPRTVPMPTDSLTYPKQTGGASASYGGETTKSATSKGTVGQLKLSAKKLTAIVLSSNDLLRIAGPETDAIIRDDLVQAEALTEDLKFLIGTGNDYEPKGLLNWAPTAHKFNATGGSTATLDQVTKDLEKLQGLVQDANVPIDDSCAIFANPKQIRYLNTLRDGSGGFVFREEIKAGKLNGAKLFQSTQLTAGKMIFARMRDVIIGDSMNMEITFHPDATVDDNGTVISGVSQDTSAFRAISKHDLAVRHEESISVLQGITWQVA